MSSAEKSEHLKGMRMKLDNGKEKKVWNIPPHVVSRSTYIRDQYDTISSDGDGRVTISEVPDGTSILTVETYLGFVLASMSRLSHMPQSKTQEAIKQSYMNFGCTYFMAQRFEDKTTRNEVVGAMVELSQTKCSKAYCIPPPAFVVNELWMKAPQGHPMRSLLVDLWTFADHERVKEEMRKFSFEKLPKQFTVDLVAALLSNVGAKEFLRRALDGALDSAVKDDYIPRNVWAADPYLE